MSSHVLPHLNGWQRIDKAVMLNLIVTIGLIAMTFISVTNFLAFNETRSGFYIPDPIIDQIAPVQLSTPIFIGTYSTVFIGLLFVLRSPNMLIKVNLSVICLLVMRMGCMYCVPLNPPDDMILLVDPFLASTFYDDQVLTRDLFFSGHTSSIVLLALLVEHRWMKNGLFILSSIVGSMLILQHVHYSVDVIAAYFFAWIAYRLGRAMADQTLLYSRFFRLRMSQRIRAEF
ncbi:MAG: phosphatase PAP2-related protein [Bacteroidota bacterium]